LTFEPFIFSQPTVFFSHNKSANNIFSRLFSVKRTGCELGSSFCIARLLIGPSACWTNKEEKTSQL
jgi:hypothetical protein